MVLEFEEQQTQKKKISWKMVSIVLAVVLVCIGGVYAYEQIQLKAYEQGVIDVNLFIQQQYTQQLKTQGYVLFPYIYNDTTIINIRLVQEVTG